MIKITCDNGTPHMLKVVETESGVDITRWISGLEIALDGNRAFVATVKFMRPKIEMDCMARYLLVQREQPGSPTS